MKKHILIFLSLIQLSYGADFYASPTLQDKYPGAFATQKSSLAFHQELENQADRDNLVEAIQANKDLHREVINFNSLELEKQVQVLRKLFELECENLKITPPELIIDETSIPGYAFFEFDFAIGGPGKVYINKAKLKVEKNKSEFIILLVHETRHSAQFQLAQKSPLTILGSGYQLSFKAQKELKTNGVKTSFCDFMLLLNEFEAFQFANYIHGALTDFHTPINDMGTLGSQYDEHGKLRLNLIDILPQLNSLELFNQLEQEQYKALYE